MEECQSSVVALDCEMVGGGKDGSINICARVCLVDDHENVLLNTYVNPLLPVTDYRCVILLQFFLSFAVRFACIETQPVPLESNCQDAS